MAQSHLWVHVFSWRFLYVFMTCWLKQTVVLEKENSHLSLKNCKKTECVLLSTVLVSTWQSILIAPNLFHKSINRQRDVQGRLWVSVWTPWILPNVDWCLHEKFAITYTFIWLVNMTNIDHSLSQTDVGVGPEAMNPIVKLVRGCQNLQTLAISSMSGFSLWFWSVFHVFIEHRQPIWLWVNARVVQSSSVKQNTNEAWFVMFVVHCVEGTKLWVMGKPHGNNQGTASVIKEQWNCLVFCETNVEPFSLLTYLVRSFVIVFSFCTSI